MKLYAQMTEDELLETVNHKQELIEKLRAEGSIIQVENTVLVFVCSVTISDLLKRIQPSIN
jgi:hypothetical protein